MAEEFITLMLSAVAGSGMAVLGRERVCQLLTHQPRTAEARDV
jgi:hypothetical protein